MSWYRGFEPFVREREPLARRNTFRVGGPAQFFAEPPDAEALSALLQRAALENIPVHFLGLGSNLLIGDGGVSGLVIHLPKAAPLPASASPTSALSPFGGEGSRKESGFGFRRHTGERVLVGAGHALPALVRWSVAQGLMGLECLGGVPGTVGAALRMNAGGKYGEVAARVESVRGFEPDGRPFSFTAAECAFTYRNSALKGRLVTECALRLAPGDPAACAQRLTEIVDEKRKSQPLAAHSAGCVFKNPRLPGVPPAGKLIDELGLKGARVGTASVSTLHANFLICDDHANARDIIALIRLICQRALDERGVRLELEVEVWGVDEEELRTAEAQAVNIERAIGNPLPRGERADVSAANAG